MKTDREGLRERARLARTWLHEDAFALWSEAGIDSEGIFFETLDQAGRGTPDRRRRVRVQARQIFCFALAAAMGWQPDRAERLIRCGIVTLTNRCRLANGLYGHWFDVETGPVGDGADLYDCAFVLLALAWAAHSLGDDAIATGAALLGRLIDERLTHAGGGYCESVPSLHVRRQNPHMHLYEASLCHARLSGDSDARRRMAAIETVMLGHFIDVRSGKISEELGLDWGRIGSNRFEAGHHYEWTWLFSEAARLADTPLAEARKRIYAVGLSLTEADGRIGLSHDVEGAPLETDRRMWCQTEALKAHLAMARHGDGAAIARACESFDLLWRDHIAPAPCPGGWIDRRAADRSEKGATIPASSGYHVFLALAYLLEETGEQAYVMG